LPVSGLLSVIPWGLSNLHPLTCNLQKRQLHYANMEPQKKQLEKAQRIMFMSGSPPIAKVCLYIFLDTGFSIKIKRLFFFLCKPVQKC
jgi:hypothetical protein